MATRPARLLTGYGGNLSTGYGGVLLIGTGYPEVDVPAETATLPPGAFLRKAPRPDDISDDDLLALVAALLLTA